MIKRELDLTKILIFLQKDTVLFCFKLEMELKDSNYKVGACVCI